MSHIMIIKTVYKNPANILVGSVVFSALLVAILYFQQFLFFEPYMIFHIAVGSELSFILIVTVSALSGLVVSTALFQIRNLKTVSNKVGGGIAASLIGAATGVCTSCVPIGFYIIISLGVAGANTLYFLQLYEIPIRVLAIAVLGVTFMMIIRNIKARCEIKINR